MTTTITAASARASLAKALAQKGADYVYSKDDPEFRHTREYAYLHADGTPACIVGHVLHDHGFTDTTLFQRWMDQPVGEDVMVNGAKLSHIMDQGALPIEFENGTVMAALNTAQREQDQGRTWGVAMQAFTHYLQGAGGASA